ncbi:LytTR family DNA-binding domain-containing protein [Salegentibacter sp. JZCK2]|uniref:LytR/AlgR family response regulator transcription factor n=1 Tax=Salegentibacter tibetensis TaxID=2873600 RepID=UPI001CCB1A32|nr:LytTR family DNA-binding domain-containing protein [Salegentibacter tibetensis]MBZ9731442.1 LytTR family DNA-binding domain-containing protein [Salegentibacter tibetensis]
MKLSCYIIDDEPLAIEVLESYVKSFEGLEYKGGFLNPVEAFRKFHQEPVDLIFLDIQMPELTGIEFIKSLKNPPMVIFTTAFREYALTGYELNVVDYLLKPVSFNRFLQAISKVLKQKNDIQEKKVEETGNEIFMIQSNKRTIKIPSKKIIYIESQRNQVKIVTELETLSIYKTLDAIEKELKNKNFLRVHRSFIVSFDKIKSWTNNDLMVQDQLIPIGRSYASEVKKQLNKKENNFFK